MNQPDDISLPFFAYGLFKPGQLCYPRICDLVESSNKCTVAGILKERDGIPLLILNTSSVKIRGYLIYFINSREEEAYQRITEIEPDEVYQWQVVNVGGLDANALIGRRAQRGSSDLEHFEEWDGKTDPFFKQGLEEVEAILKANSNFDWDYRALLRLQMAYMLLWTAIERYAGLKYHLGNRVVQKVYQIANEDCFARALKKVINQERHIFGTSRLDKYTLAPNSPKEAIKYYYQVRSNTIHRGKAVVRDFDIIKSSLEELLFIFKEILDESFRE